MKIFLSGPSGIGKTTMAKHIAELYGIKFVEGSSKVLWGDFGIKSHLDLIQKCDKDIDFAIEFQTALLRYRKEVTENLTCFVTDRSPLDNIVYYLLQLSHKIDAGKTLEYINICSESYPKDKYMQVLMYLTYPMTLQEIENDGFRITNHYYQLMVSNVFRMIYEHNWLHIDQERTLTFDTWDFNYKVYEIDRKIKTLWH